jgi:hypothetical protein
VRTYAPTSAEIKDLKGSFQTGVTEFKKALEAGGAKVAVSHTYRSDQAAYLWHWAWKIPKRKCQPKDATPYSLNGRPVPEIEWDHGNLLASIKGAEDMVKGFNLSMSSKLAPSLNTRHRQSLAIDMTITWSGTIHVKKKDGTLVPLNFGPVNTNTKLHEVGASYGVKNSSTILIIGLIKVDNAAEPLRAISRWLRRLDRRPSAWGGGQRAKPCQ